MSAGSGMVRGWGGSLGNVYRICWSSPISWSCYLTGVLLALDPAMALEMRDGGPGLLVIVVGIIGFFLLAASIQRHMQLPLSADHFGPPGSLFTSGPFARTRNPIYVAFLLPLASLAYFSTFAAMVAAVVYVTAMNALVITAEERELERRFGEAYRAYAERTPRWLA